MSDSPPDRKHRPLRWTPIWAIGFSFALFIFALTWTSAVLAAALIPSLGAAIVAMLPAVYNAGPLGKPSIEDDEREAALRKDSYLACFALLAFLNCLGQPFLMILSRWQNWPTAHSVTVAASVFMLNAALFLGFPTLYASWALPQLPKE
jgi:hypothetical protein